jgi:drug/metabolite transporter (DMT)-like permease
MFLSVCRVLIFTGMRVKGRAVLFWEAGDMVPHHYHKYIWVLLTALAFGTMEIALKLGGTTFSALQLTFLRFLIGGLFLLPFAIHDLRKRGYRLTRKDFGLLAGLGLVNIVISMTLFQMSVMHTHANLAAVLISFNPVITMVLAHFIVHEKFTQKRALVLAICVTGLCFVANPFHLAQGNEPIGILMGLGAATAFALNTVLSRKHIERLGGLTINSLSFIMGAMMELVLLFVFREPIISNITLDTLPLLAYVSLVVTGFGYFCFMRAIKTGGAANASYAFFVKPIIAMLLAAWILSEPITWNIVLGIALIVGGFLFSAYQPKKVT